MNDLSDKDTEILRLVACIRQMDQKIYRMGQCLSWKEMQPVFESLHDETQRRMADESRRIQTLLIPEIRQAYLNASPPAVTPQPSPLQLEGSKHAGSKGVQVRKRRR